MFFHACLYFICLDLHALYFMPCFPMLCSSFCSMLMFGSTCSHAWYYVSNYALLRSTCLYACSMLLCLCPWLSHACMLGFAFSHAFMFISTCLDVYPHAYMCMSMLICVDWCVYMLRSMFSTCFMPSSMCLRASHHVYVLRPRPCLSCHVLL